MTPGRALDALPAGSFVHVDSLPGTSAAASSAVKRARERGDLVRIRKGLLFKGVKTRYGMTKPSPEAVAREVLGKGAGPTGYSAARSLGLTTQLPAKPSIAVAGPLPTGMDGVELTRRNNMARRSLQWTEIGLLELLRGEWETTVEGGWPALVRGVSKAIADGSIRMEEVRKAMRSEHNAKARTNLLRLDAAA